MAAVKAIGKKSRLTSMEFEEIFKKYDKDGNGEIEATELTSLLTDLLKELGISSPDDATIKKYRHEWMEKYDSNFDGKLNRCELARMLPTEDRFLANFRNEVQVTSLDFMQIWKQYDSDRNGYLEAGELDSFLRDLFKSGSKDAPADKLKDYKETIMELYDSNRDNKLDLAELAKLMSENFMSNFKARKSLGRDEFNSIFSHYDQDGSGYIEDKELLDLLRDIMTRGGQETPSAACLENHKITIMALLDDNKDGKLSRDELAMFLSK